MAKEERKSVLILLTRLKTRSQSAFDVGIDNKQSARLASSSYLVCPIGDFRLLTYIQKSVASLKSFFFCAITSSTANSRYSKLTRCLSKTMGIVLCISSKVALEVHPGTEAVS